MFRRESHVWAFFGAIFTALLALIVYLAVNDDSTLFSDGEEFSTVVGCAAFASAAFWMAYQTRVRP